MEEPFEVKDTKFGRVYSVAGVDYPSVTSILGLALPKPGLESWKRKKIIETAARNRKELSELTQLNAIKRIKELVEPASDDAMYVGTAVHKHAEDHALDQPTAEPTAETVKYVAAHTQFITDWNPKFLETEVMVVNRTYGYAGRLDAVLDMAGRIVIGDYKSGKGVWPEYALQLSAYRYAESIIDVNGERPMVATQGGLVIKLRPEGYQVVPVSTSKDVFDTFLSLLDLYNWLSRDSSFVIRTALEPPKEQSVQG